MSAKPSAEKDAPAKCECDARDDARLGLHDLWREAAEKRIDAGIDWPAIVLTLLRHVEEAWDEGASIMFGNPDAPDHRAWRDERNPYRAPCGRRADTCVLPPGTSALPIHRTEAGYPNCATCDGGGCLDCTDPA